MRTLTEVLDVLVNVFHLLFNLLEHVDTKKKRHRDSELKLPEFIKDVAVEVTHFEYHEQIGLLAQLSHLFD